MHCLRIALFGIVLFLSILILGCCFAPNLTPTNPLNTCNSDCQISFPHSTGVIQNGSCTCPCAQGYEWQNGKCISSEDILNADPVLKCDYQCQGFPHTFGSLKAGNCTCPCLEGYLSYNRTCVSSKDFNDLMMSSCNSACAKSFPHSVSRIDENGNCTCPCEKGYVSYNRTCITPNDFVNLAPILCTKDHPVLKIYDWSYKQKGYYVYLCYKNDTSSGALENRSNRVDYWNFVSDPYSEGSVSTVANLLVNLSSQQGFSKNEQVDFAISFVQSLPYTFDNVTTPYDNYPRYPSETIYADGGDCEDTSILLAAILNKMGYDVVLLTMPKHVAVGVYCNPSDFDYPVSSYPYNGRNYCYVETTGENWKIGQLPDSHLGAEIEVVPLRSPQPDLYIASGYRFASHHDSSYTYIDITGIRVDNFGPVAAKNVKIYTALEASEDGKVWDQHTYSLGDIPPRGYYNYEVTNLHITAGNSFRVLIRVSADNANSVEKRSDWANWN